MNSHPGTFYTFEPLYVKSGIVIEREKAIDLIKNSFKCKPPKTDTNGFCIHNFRFWDLLDDKTWDGRFQQYQKYFSTACVMFPIRLIKTIRFSFKDAEQLLSDPDIGKNLKIIYLFRDPRGIFQSYVSKVNWCNGTTKDRGPGYLKSCKVSFFCDLMKSDIQAARNILGKYPGKFS